MSYNRWLFSIFAALLLLALVAFGAAMRPTASASPALQVETATEGTATEEITSTATLTETATVTETETPTATTEVTSTATAIPTTTTPTASPSPIAKPFWSFAAQFICGEQPAEVAGQPIAGEPPVKPGNYATQISVHNPHYLGPIQVRKKVVLLIDRGTPVGHAPDTATPQPFSPMFELPDDSATMEDCNSIWDSLNPGIAPPTPMPLMTGYLVVVSPANLDVVSVLTATTSTSNLEPAGITMQTTMVEPKRVLIAAEVFPDRLLPPEEQFTDR